VFALTMTLQSKSPETVGPATERRNRRPLWRAIATFRILLAGVTILLFVISDTGAKRFVWLTQADLKPGTMEKLRDRLMRLTSPLWRGYWSRQPFVLIDSTMLAVPAGYAVQFGLGRPITTNDDGFHGWLISSAELTALRQQIKILPGEMNLGSPRVQTFVGGWAGISQLSGQAGLTVTLRAKPAGDSWNLTIGSRLTELTASVSSNAVVLQTNLAAACRATIPNAGALVIRGASRIDSKGTNYWLIVSPTAVDGQGRPIKR
jgi:hypothetical protein